MCTTAMYPSQPVTGTHPGPRGRLGHMTATLTDRQFRHAPNAELEASLEAYFRKRVRLSLGGVVYKLAPTETGIPDRMVALPGGRVMLVELKTVFGTLSPRQKYVHHKLAELGTVVPVLYGRPGIDAWIQEQFPTDAQLREQARAAKGK